MRLRIALMAVLACVMPLAIAGCGTDAPTRLYTLSAMEEQPVSFRPTGIGLGVGPITLPKYLDRPQIVTRLNSNSLAQADLDQWAGDLNDNITRVLATNLSQLLATQSVSFYPWKDQARVEYQVTIDVTKFEQDPDGSTVLTTFWSIINPNDEKVLVMRRSTYRDKEQAGGAGSRPYDAAVAAMSRDLAALSRDIAGTIKGLKPS